MIQKIIADNYEERMKRIDRKTYHLVREEKLISSGYAFGTFSSFSSINKLKQFSKRKRNVEDIFGLMYNTEENFEVTDFLDEKDII